MKHRELSIFTWAYVAKVPAKMRRKRSKILCLMRGYILSDWVGNGKWLSPIVAIAPPMEGLQCQTT